jgi:hypothetical protein
LAITTRLIRSARWKAAPSRPSTTDVQDGHGCSTSGSRAVLPSGAPTSPDPIAAAFIDILANEALITPAHVAGGWARAGAALDHGR